MRDKEKKSGRTFLSDVAFNLLSLAAPLLFAFVATPLLVRGIGVEDYGYYSIVLAIIGSAFTTGIGRIPVKYIPEKRAEGRSGELKPLLSSAILITLAVGLVEALALAAVSRYLVFDVLSVPAPDAGGLVIAIYLACLIGPMMMISQIFQSTLQGVHRFRHYSILTIAASFLMNTGSVLLALNGFSYRGIILWNLAVTSATAAAFLIFARSEVPELKILRRIDREPLKKVAWFALSIFIYQSITSIYYLFERSYVLRNFGAEALTYFTIPLMLGIYLHGLILAFSHVVIPKFNERLQHRTALSATYQALTKIVVAVAAFLTLINYFLGGQLLTLWLGGDFATRSYSLLVIHSAAFAIIAIVIPAWSLSEAARKPGLNASSPFVTSVFGVIAVLVLGSAFQTEGVAAGRLIGALAAVPIIIIVEYLVFEAILWKLWLNTIVNVCAASLILLLLSQFTQRSLGETWPGLVVSLLVLSVGYWGVLFAFGHVKRDEIRSAFGPRGPYGDDAELMAAVQ